MAVSERPASHSSKTNARATHPDAEASVPSPRLYLEVPVLPLSPRSLEMHPVLSDWDLLVSFLLLMLSSSIADV